MDHKNTETNVWVRPEGNDDKYCPADFVAQENRMSAGVDDECVEVTVVERYAGNIEKVG